MAQPTHIFVITAGWVLAGRKDELSGHVTIHDASVIRTWGTDRGLGQLALSGPTPSTVLDPCGEARVPVDQILFELKVSPAARWP